MKEGPTRTLTSALGGANASPTRSLVVGEASAETGQGSLWDSLREDLLRQLHAYGHKDLR